MPEVFARAACIDADTCTSKLLGRSNPTYPGGDHPVDQTVLLFYLSDYLSDDVINRRAIGQVHFEFGVFRIQADRCITTIFDQLGTHRTNPRTCSGDYNLSGHNHFFSDNR